jgi:hypothetical protein
MPTDVSEEHIDSILRVKEEAILLRAGFLLCLFEP